MRSDKHGEGCDGFWDIQNTDHHGDYVEVEASCDTCGGVVKDVFVLSHTEVVEAPAPLPVEEGNE